MAGIAIIPVLVELLLGGSSLSKIILKLLTRLTPLWFAASRAVEVVEALAVAREIKRRRCMPVQTRHFPARKISDNKQKKGKEEQRNRPRSQTIITQAINKERVERSTRPAVPVPVWLGVTYVVIIWVFCIFAWVRFAQLAAPCSIAGTPWPTNCRSPAHPLFDLALPGPAADLCACNSFTTAPDWSANSSVYDCSAPQFMEDVHSGLFAKSALETTAPYVQTMMFQPGG